MSNPWPQMGQLLLEQGRVTHGQLESALEEQRRSGQPLGEILVSREVISRVDLAAALSTQWTWNRKHTDAEEAPAVEEPAPAEQHDVAVEDEEPAAADARLEALESQVSDLTKAFGVLQRFIRTQAEELEALRAASAERDEQISAVA